MREKPKDDERLIHMIEAIDNIFEFIENKSFEDFRNNKMLRFAIIKNLEIIGEAAYLLAKKFKLEHDSVQWNDIIGMRHILVHDYYQVSDEIIWATIDSDLLPLKKKLSKLLTDK